MDQNYLNAMLAPSRTLTARGEIRFAGGTAAALTPAMITGFSLREGTDGEKLPGSVISAVYSLKLANTTGEWLPGGSVIGHRTMIGAAVTLEIGVKSGSGFLYAPCGDFVIEDCAFEEGSGEAVVTGQDALSRALAGALTDTLAYPKTLAEIIAHIFTRSGIAYTGNPACNGNVIFAKKPAWGAGCTLRRALGNALEACGSFARLKRDGTAEILPARAVNVVLALGPAHCTRMTSSSREFVLGRIRTVPYGETEGAADIISASGGALPEDSGNTLIVRGNPLFAGDADSIREMADSLLYALLGMDMKALDLEWRGSPELRAGDRVSVTDTHGAVMETLALTVSLDYGKGLTCSLSCMLEDDKASSRIILPSGFFNMRAAGGGRISPNGAAVQDLSGTPARYLANAGFVIGQECLSGVGAEVSLQTDDLAIAPAAAPEDRCLEVTAAGVNVRADRVYAPGIAGNVPNTFTGGAVPWLGSIRASLASIGKWLLADSVLTVPGGTSGAPAVYAEHLVVAGFKGAQLKIVLSPYSVIAGSVTVKYCDDVYFYAAAEGTAFIIGTGYKYALFSLYPANGRFRMDNVNISGYPGRTGAADGTQVGIALYSTLFEISGCCIERTCGQCVSVNAGALGIVTGCFGGVAGGYTTAANLGYGVRAVGGSQAALHLKTFVSALGDTAYLAVLLSSNPTAAASVSAAPAVPAGKSYAVSAGYWRKSEDAGIGPWTAGQPRQGETVEHAARDPALARDVKMAFGHYGVFYLAGAANIPGDIPAGKSIVSASLSLRRDPSGPAGAVAARLYGHNQAAYPGAFSPEAAFSDTGVAAAFLPGQERTIALDAATITALSTGSIRGFGLMAIGPLIRFDVYGELAIVYG